MNRTSNFASIRFRLAGVLVSVLLLTAFSFTAMLRRRPAVVNAANHLSAEYSMSNISASAPPQSDKPHTMAATYYSFQGNLKASINLNNKGLVPLEVKPTLFNLAGERLEVPAVTVDATTFQVFDLAEWAGPGGLTFQQGSLQLFYRGRDMLLGAQIKIVDSASSVIFDEQLAEPAAMFSSRLEGLWWLPTHDSQVSIAISNTTDSTLVASLDRDGMEPKQQGSKELILQPHQTVLIDPAQDLSDRPAVMQETGGISISHSGKPGSVIARAMIQNSSIGFSSAVQFADPGKAKSSNLHGAGLRLGEIAGEELTPMVVARNISDRTAVLHGRIRYIKRDGGEGVTQLREVKLRAGEVKAWEISEITRPQSAGVESAGLEIDYSTQPGSVVVSALSLSRSGNQVFQAPMLDVAAQKSSTGAYPFYMYGTSSTVVYIKNTTAVEQRYVAHLNYESGNYRMGLKTISPGETVTIDIRALRDRHILDDEGRTIPPDVAHGQVRWTLIQQEGTDLLALIGRAEQVDVVKAISSSYACQNCCGDSPQNAFITPSSVEMEADQSVFLEAFEVRSDCYGFTYAVPQSATWSSSNSSVASVSGGQVTAVEGGETTITASWNSFSTAPTQCGPGSGFDYNPEPTTPCCGSLSVPKSAGAQVRVKPRISGLDPARALIGIQRSVNLVGTGFGNSKNKVMVQVGGTGISVVVDAVTTREILATFTIAANAQVGNHAVSVRVRNQPSNSVNFFVQVPTKLRRDSISALQNEQGGCGATKTVSYTLLDQAGQPILSDDTLKETISNFSGPEGLRPPPVTSRQMSSGAAPDVVGYETNTPICPPPFTASWTQAFSVVVATKSYSLSTTNSISVGRDASGTRFVNVTITTP